jgi:hypothetical protein
MKRSKLCNKFLKDQGVNCCSIDEREYSPNEGHFSWRGCDCCKTGLGNTVYDCIGYDPKTKTVVEIGQVCSDCICYFYNGDDSEIESEAV